MPHCHTYIQALRRQGYRITPQREMIIESLAHSGKHMSAEDIYQEVHHRTKAMNLATVYRTLDLLVERGFATRLSNEEGKVVYATRQHGAHLHLVCRICGQSYLLEAALFEPIKQSIETELGFCVDADHMTLSGVCKHCLSEISKSDVQN
jgi:Fur family ferric uptake transcriptional regulator